MMGFEGTTVTPQIKELIQKHYIGSILLTAKNLKGPLADVSTLVLCIDGT